MLGGWSTGIQILHTADYGIGAELPGEASGVGTMYGVQEGLSKEVTSCARTNPAWRGKRGVRAGGKRGKRGRQSQRV